MMVGVQPLASDISLVDAVHTVRERFRLVLALTAAIFVAMSVLIFTEEPVYRAYVTLAPSPPLVDPSPMSVTEGLLGMTDVRNIGVFQAQTSPGNALALLRSKAMSRRFIEAEGLLPILFSDRWDAESHTWGESETDRQPTLGDALRLFEREVRFVSRNKMTGFVRVNIEWSDPELAANWANRLVEMTDNLIRERDIAEARQSIRYLEERALDTSIKSVKELIYQLIESQVKKIMVASAKENYVFTIIDPAVAQQSGDTINMPVSFKLSLALVFALGCSMLWVVVASAFGGKAD